MNKTYLFDLASFVESIWAVSGVKIEELNKAATADCFKVYAKEGVYFLKRFQGGHKAFQADKEAEICCLLSQSLLPVSEIIYTKDQKAYAVYNEQIYQLQSFVDGYTPLHNSIDESLLCDASSFLGEIHLILQNTEMRSGFDSGWLGKFNETQYICRYEQTLCDLKKSIIDDSIKKKIENDLCFRIELTRKMHTLSNYFDGLTYSASHGDYTPSQLICRDNKIVKIVDFSNACRMPTALELIRFYFLASSDCKNPFEFSIDRFKKYLDAYCEKFPLSETDARNLPYIYLYYMGRNRFIYRDYLKTKDETDFSVSAQRADISKYLYENADKISKELVNWHHLPSACVAEITKPQ